MNPRYFQDAIEAPHTFEQLRTASVGHILRPLTKLLSDRCHHFEIVSALLISKWQFSSGEPDDRGVNESRAYACEIVAWRFVSHLSESERIDYLLHELPPVASGHGNFEDHEDHDDGSADLPALSRSDIGAAERAGLLVGQSRKVLNIHETDDEPISTFVGLNALEIAAIVDAKKFLSQRVVQNIVDDIWNGRIIFWESLSVYSRKKAKVYNKKRADPFCRLRVPKYQKGFEAMFFALFLVLYYAVLVERNPKLISPIEVLLFIWITAFTYEEVGDFQDAGRSFYATDFWSLWDIGIIGIGFAYMISSK